MGGGDNGCGSGLLRAINIQQIQNIPQMEQHQLMLFCLENVTHIAV